MSIVVGPGGIGKTALVLQTLHAKYAGQIARVLYLRVQPLDSGEELRVELVRALAEALAKADLPWREMLKNADTLAGVAIDLAEAAGEWVVIEDLHHAEPDQARKLLTTLAQYSRSVRWIVTTRTDPRIPELGEQILTLVGLAEKEVEKLAKKLAVSLEPAALKDIEGSPWRTRQHAQGSRNAQIAYDFDDAQTAFLKLLSAFRFPVAEDVLARLQPIPDLHPLDSLLERSEARRACAFTTRGAMCSPPKSAWSRRAHCC